MSAPGPAFATGLTAQVAEFVAGLELAAIPAEVLARARRQIIDSIGCGIAGGGTELARQLRAVLLEEVRPGEVPVLGTDLSLPPAAAAFANAVAINALDSDDGLEDAGKGMGHPGATIVAAALSGCTATTSGAELLTAIVAGYEINNRLIHAIQPGIERFRQVYGVCQHQSIGGAMAVGRLAGLDAARLDNVMGFAGTLTQLPSLRKYNWDRRPLVSFKDFVAPAAESAVRAVRMDAAGLVGSKAVLDGETGFWRMIGSDRFAPEILVGGLGRDWTLKANTIKPYPTCRWMHAALSSFETLRDAQRLRPEQIARVTIHASRAMLADFMDPRPATMVDAQFAFPHAVACMALRLPAHADWFADLARPDLLALADRVAGEVDPEADRLMSETRKPAGRASVTTTDGTVLQGPFVPLPPGSEENPLPGDFVARKFLMNVAPVLGDQRATTLLAALDRLETQPNALALFRAG